MILLWWSLYLNFGGYDYLHSHITINYVHIDLYMWVYNVYTCAYTSPIIYIPNPYINTYLSPTCRQANGVQDASIFGATGDCPEEDALVKRMRERMEALTLENRELAQENAAMRAELENRKVLQTGEPDQQEPEGVTDEAARKRLERICKRRADGFLSFA